MTAVAGSNCAGVGRRLAAGIVVVLVTIHVNQEADEESGKSEERVERTMDAARKRFPFWISLRHEIVQKGKLRCTGEIVQRQCNVSYPSGNN